MGTDRWISPTLSGLSRATLQAVFSATDAPLLLFDTTGRLRAGNRAAHSRYFAARAPNDASLSSLLDEPPHSLPSAVRIALGRLERAAAGDGFSFDRHVRIAVDENDREHDSRAETVTLRPVPSSSGQSFVLATVRDRPSAGSTADDGAFADGRDTGGGHGDFSADDLFVHGPTVLFRWRATDGWPIEAVTANVTDVFGYNPERLVDDAVAFESLVHEDDLPTLRAQIDANSTPETDRFRCDPYRVYTADGDSRWVLEHTKPARRDGELTHYHGYLVDITERKQREQELRPFKQAVNHTAHAVYITDADGIIEYVNPAFETLTGYTAVDALGSTPELLESGEHDQSFHADLWETVGRGEPYEHDVVNERSDGDTVVFNQTVSPILDADGEPMKFVAVAQDITDLKTYESKLETQLENLEVLNQVVRHDIRNDLQLVSAYADILDGTLSDRNQHHLEIIMRSAQNAIDLTTTARELTNTMLQTADDTTAVSLETRLSHQIDRLLSAHPDVSVTVDGAIPSVDVVADDLLGAVFRNLLKNAVQHNRDADPVVEVSVAKNESTATVRIADNGPGIPDHRKQTVFGRGEQGLESAGTGVGLYLVDTLVERYGGSVAIEDNEPTGTVFVVELPLAA